MSEEDRTHVYAWLREEIGERRAEYVMSCLAPVPLADLVTKEHLTDELSRFAALLRLEFAEQRAEDRREAAAQREGDRRETANEFATVRSEAKQQFRWVIGTIISAAGVLLAAMGTFVAIA